MNIHNKCRLLALFCTLVSNQLFAQTNVQPKFVSYRAEMESFQAAIQKNYFDSASGYYFAEADHTKKEKKGNYTRDYTYLWSFCALYQAANEMEKIETRAQFMAPLLKIMNDYYNPASPKPGFSDYIMKLQPGERYYDDNEWIGITALDAYARTKDKSYLELGQTIYDFVMSGSDSALGGGIYWKETSKSSKNTCSNGPGILVALQLYLATHDTNCLNAALTLYKWTNEKLQAPSGLYYDNISTRDGNVNRGMLSYNTGTMLEANVYLYEITGEAKYLQTANTIADSSLTYFYGRGKFRDGYWFNAVLLRAYQHLLADNKDLKYVLGFKKCLDHALQNERNADGLFQGRGVYNLVDQGGMLEILARYAWLESHYDLAQTNSPTAVPSGK